MNMRRLWQWCLTWLPEDESKRFLVVTVVVSILFHILVGVALITGGNIEQRRIANKRGEALLVDIAPDKPKETAPLGDPSRHVGPVAPPEPPRPVAPPTPPPPKASPAPPPPAAPRIAEAPKTAPKAPPQAPKSADPGPAPKTAPPTPEPESQTAKASTEPQPVQPQPPAPAANPRVFFLMTRRPP